MAHDNPFADPSAIDGHQTKVEIELAFQENMSKQQSPTHLGAKALKHAVVQQAEKLNRHRESATGHEAIDDAFDITRELFPNISRPHRTEFAEKGVDFDQLANKFDDMRDNGLDPVVIIVPNNTTPAFWMKLYEEKLKANDEIPSNPFENDYLPLHINRVVAENWSKFDDLPEFGITGFVSSNFKMQGNQKNVVWNICVVQGTNQANLSQSKGSEITIPEYLTLQASNILTGKNPVDSINNSFTRLDGSFNTQNTNCVPIGRWMPSGSVDIDFTADAEYLGRREVKEA